MTACTCYWDKASDTQDAIYQLYSKLKKKERSSYTPSNRYRVPRLASLNRPSSQNNVNNKQTIRHVHAVPSQYLALPRLLLILAVTYIIVFRPRAAINRYYYTKKKNRLIYNNIIISKNRYHRTTYVRVWWSCLQFG